MSNDRSELFDTLDQINKVLDSSEALRIFKRLIQEDAKIRSDPYPSESSAKIKVTK